MGLNIKNPEVEALINEVARATGETKTEAVRQAMLDRKNQLALPSVEERVRAHTEWLEKNVWSLIPPEQLGKRLTKEEEEDILGFGPDGC